MKRIARISALFCCALFLVAGGTTLAQEKGQKEQKAQTQKPPVWVALDKGVDVIRLWDVAKPPTTEPEIAILRLSNDRYAEFQKAPKEFVNRYKVYSKDVRDLPACAVKEYKMAGGNGWIIAEPHWPDSGVECAAFSPAGWPERKASAKSKP
jgi:hypothetical protein